jgi:DNA helicase HerA-like ATPase
MKTIDFSPTLKLPVSVCTQKLAFLGISGSGKTYGAGKLVEGVIEAGAQVVIVDVIGNWYGLRLAADGKKPGISIPILGGVKGDVPLDSYGGKQAAELVVDSNASVILDISDFTGGETRRFVTDFATSLLALKKRSPSPTLVVWEECQDIVPQRVMGEVAKMVGAVEKLIKKGRNYGVGTVLISQRAAAALEIERDQHRARVTELEEALLDARVHDAGLEEE